MGANAAVLWTGGKDSCLALHEAIDQGIPVGSLVTFAPKDPRFHAHPIEFMQLQSEALGIPHRLIEIGEPYEAGYESALVLLKNEFGVTDLVTGDIAEVGGQPNWIRERARPSHLEVRMPLWNRDRLEVLERMLFLRFKVIFSCVRTASLPPDWIGREINDASLEDLLRIHRKNGLDICGEQGEYHTLVLDAPLFKKKILIEGFERSTAGELAAIDIQKMSLEEK